MKRADFSLARNKLFYYLSVSYSFYSVQKSSLSNASCVQEAHLKMME